MKQPKPSFAPAAENDFFAELLTESHALLARKKRGKLADYRFFVRGVLALSAVVLSYTWLFASTGFAGLILRYLLFGCCCLWLAFCVAHDAAHHTVFHKKRDNHLLYMLVFNLLGVSARLWKKRHLESHHPYPNIDGHDADLEDVRFLRFSAAMPLQPHHRFQVFYAPFLYLSYTLYWMWIKDFTFLFRHGKGRRIRFVLRLVLLKSVYLFAVLIGPGFYHENSFSERLIAFLLMHALLSWLLLFTFLITHYTLHTADAVSFTEEPEIRHSAALHQVRSSVDFHPGNRLVTHLVGGFNCHTLHHLLPGVNSIHYPALEKVLTRVLNKHGIKRNQTGYWSGILSHLRFLKKRGQC